MKFISTIDKKLHHQSGVYILKNSLNDLVYIGATNSFRNRKYGHKRSLINNRHHSPRLQEFYNQNPDVAISMHVVEFCDITLLKEREFYWLNYYNCTDPEFGFNERNHVGFSINQETKEKIAKTLKVFYQKNGHSNIGRKATAEQREKISKNHHNVKGENNPNYGKKMSDETKRRIGEAKKKGFALRKEQGIPNPHTGMKRSEETKRKLAEARKLRYAIKKNISISL